MRDVIQINREVMTSFDAMTENSSKDKWFCRKIETSIEEDAQFTEGDPVRFLPSWRLNSKAEKRKCLEAIAGVMETGNFTSGSYVGEFERRLEHFYDAHACVGVSSGTDAIKIGLKAVGVCANDEVIVPVNSFAATENAVFGIGAIPIYANVDASYNLLPSEIARLTTARTKAVVPVCLYGSIRNIREVCAVARNSNLRVILDAAQCFGIQKIVNLCDFLALSFNPFKNLGAYGKAGALLTSHEALAQRARRYSYHGFEEGKKNIKKQNWGFNGRLDNIQASILMVKLQSFERNATKRSYLAARYLEGMRRLGQVCLDLPVEHVGNTWHLFPICVKGGRRDALIAFARHSNVELDVYYPILSHRYASI